jgi:hypothetical protein
MFLLEALTAGHTRGSEHVNLHIRTRVGPVSIICVRMVSLVDAPATHGEFLPPMVTWIVFCNIAMAHFARADDFLGFLGWCTEVFLDVC